MKVFFLDIDGVFIPQRAYFMANQTKPIVKTFDPCVVGMVNKLCDDHGVKLVIHSSWLRSSFAVDGCVMEHMIEQGLKREHFHDNPKCLYRFSGTRWHAIWGWLDDNKVDHFWVLEDEPCPDPKWFEKGTIVQTDFAEGLTFNQYLDIDTQLKEIK